MSLKDLGWQKYAGNCEEIKECQDQNHILNRSDHSSIPYRGDHIIYSCNECNIMWHIDSSD